MLATICVWLGALLIVLGILGLTGLIAVPVATCIIVGIVLLFTGAAIRRFDWRI